MKVTAIIGSHRKNGNTAWLVNTALEECRKEGIQSELIFLSDYNIGGCRACERCRQDQRCHMDDDMQKIYPHLEDSDGLILASPTYFYNITTHMKAFIERTYCYLVFDPEDRHSWLSVNDSRGTKYAAIIAVGEQHDEQFLGFTAEAMSKPLIDLNYRIVDVVKAINLFGIKDAQTDAKNLAKARLAGKRLANTLLLRQVIEEKRQHHSNESFTG